MKFLLKISVPALIFLMAIQFFSCKKDKFITDAGAKLEFSRDSVLFDTVFTSIGSANRQIRIRNKNKQKIKISSIQLAGGSASPFKVNVDGSPGISFSDLEIAAEDSMYIFLQVNVNPNNVSSPFVLRDSLLFQVNGNMQKVQLEAWGQNAYYHRPTDAIKFEDGTYLPFSYLNNDTNAITVTWPNDKPHVIYGYLAIYTGQKLTIPAGTQIYLNPHAGLWVYKGGELHVQGQKGNEVVFQGVRREKLYEDMPGQWDRIWINEGSDQNEINYAIIKNGYIGIQTEFFGDTLGEKGQLTLTNTKIQNMSMWGLYSVAYKVYAGNNVISNCQEHSLNIEAGGNYAFIHCTFANYWYKDKPREKPTINLKNYIEEDVIPLNVYFGNCIIDGKLDEELGLDLKDHNTYKPKYKFSSCLLKSNRALTDTSRYVDARKINPELKYLDANNYNFTPNNETQVKGFTGPNAIPDLNKFPQDINGDYRKSFNVTVGAYETK